MAKQITEREPRNNNSNLIGLRGAILCAGVATALAGLTAPPAAADPPNYTGYHAVDPKPFQTFNTYGGGGAQFTSPSGQLCRIVVISRGMFAYIECLGELHGSAEGNNLVRITTTAPSGFSKTTREEFLSTQRVGPDGVTREPTGAAGFIPLPAGSSLTYTSSVWSGTCAVDTASTRCTVTSNHSDGTSTTKSFTSTPTDTAID
ncbi:hypothetical protein BRW65_26700 [Mycobacterium paraffinicum]|uniref:Uncharacterized protein n=1 Tax=Mycobacterium paraffinicum TaxID=53378 RepID=A0A1Q4HGZ8_9MYCO|nr:hypothetical protein [Mycobacterium paraffinicum]OJZ66810.1 hypothetical protein BRW65_26700 [Mycobacterium paraffinicum]